MLYPSRPRNHSRVTHFAAFTLVELLACIAILAILAAILIPAVGAVRRKAVDSQCINNLRQLTMGARTYANDHDGQFPYPAIAQDVGTYEHAPHYYTVDAYEETLEEYVGSRFDSMYCPGALSDDPNGNYDPEVQRQSENPNDFVSYQYFNGKSDSMKTGSPRSEYDMLYRNTITADPRYAMFGCLTYIIGQRCFAHYEGRSTGEVEGMFAGFGDGSVHWVDFEDMEPYSADGAYYWPIPDSH